MSEVVIRVENLFKEYRLGVLSHQTLYRDLQSWWSRVRGRDDPNSLVINAKKISEQEKFLALNDVSFEVNRGEVLGVIGRNGAGKSTLLKILSKVTTPTQGEVKIKGRIASLLEVGTGFHPELTGRENVFLNGAILGMTKKEIASKFDEIVDFAEIEKFIDTPVKRYSSGMYVRLAFAVAAHLEPEILIIDEVLAVGDVEFQKKCLGKMKDVSGHGRTVLFVSHNMSALKNLCTRAILLDDGKIIMNGETERVVHHYISAGVREEGERVWDDVSSAPAMSEFVRFKSVRVSDEREKTKTQFDVKELIEVELEYCVLKEKYSLNVHFYFKNDEGQTLFVAMDNINNPYNERPNPVGWYKEKCTIPAHLLNEGFVFVQPLICTFPTSVYYVTVHDAIGFNVTDNMEASGVRGNWTRDWPKTIFRPELKWKIDFTPQN